MKKNILSIIFLSVLSVCQAQNTLVKLKNYTINDGLSQGSGRDLFIDSKGFLWIGTENGLNKFDGYNFTVFKNKPGKSKTLSENWISKIIEDDKKNLWLATNNGDVNKLNLITEEIIRFNINKKDNANKMQNDIRFMFQDNNKNIWALSMTRGLYKFNQKNNKYKNYRSNENDRNSISDNRVITFYEDKKTNLWFGTFNGINKYNHETKKFKRYIVADTTENTIRQIFEDKSGNLWLAATTGLYKYNNKKDKFIHFINQADNPNSISNNNIIKIFEDNSGNIWFGTANGLNKYNSKDKTFNRYYSDPENENSLSGNIISTIADDNSGNLWIGTFSGLCKYNLNTEKFTRIENVADQDLRVREVFTDKIENIWIRLMNGKLQIVDKEQNKLSDVLTFMMSYTIDKKNGTIWFGSFGGGIFKYHPVKDKFENYSADKDNKNLLSENGIWKIFEDSKGYVWIGTITNGVNKFNPKTKRFIHYKNTPNCENCIAGNWILSIEQINENEILFGTLQGVSSLNTVTNKFTTYRNIPGDTTSISNNNINVIKFDNKKTLWIGSNRGGLNEFDIEKKTAKRYFNIPKNANSISSNSIYAIEIIDDKIWIATNIAIDVLDTKTNTFKHYYNNSTDSTGIQGSMTTHISADKDKNIWFATDAGICKLDNKTQKFEYFSTEEGLANEMAYCVIHDDFNNIWISTNNGISRFDKTTEKFYNFDVTDGLQSNEFNMSAHCKTKDGKIYLGGTLGFNAFYPNKIRLDTIPPQTVITKFKIFNKEIKVLPFDKKQLAENFSSSEIISEGGTYFLNKNITYKEEIILSWQEKVISFEFAGLHFASPENNTYRYILENFDEEWNNAGKQRFVTYTNLPAGEYIFKVMSANADGVWDKTPTKIKLIITPPWWNTKWFKLTAIMLIIILVSIYIKSREQKLKKQKQILENRVKERTAELFQQKEEILTQRDEIEEKAKKLNIKNVTLLEKNVEINQQKEEIQSIADNLEKANKSINKQRHELEEIHKKTTDGINYASRIQQAILPNNNIFNKYFSEHFIFYQPKEVVSGDFYFVKKIKNYIVFAAADCTGHGVPGAFVSMLGISYLNEIIRRPKIVKANQVLEELRIQIKESLKQNKKFGTSKDGMDMALCIIDIETNRLQYAGAYNPLYLIVKAENKTERITELNKNSKIKIYKKKLSEENQKLIEIKADRQPVSVYYREKPFVNFEMQIEKGDTLYMFSDGYIDQFNHRTGEKFKSRRFKNLILAVQNEQLKKQVEIIKQTFEEWKKDSFQVDDIVIIGIKI